MKKSRYAYAAVFISLILMAFVCAPHSCEWGNTVYFIFGFIMLMILFALPFFLADIQRKWAYAFVVSFLFLAAWILLFMLCGFRIMCRLY